MREAEGFGQLEGCFKKVLLYCSCFNEVIDDPNPKFIIAEKQASFLPLPFAGVGGKGAGMGRDSCIRGLHCLLRRSTLCYLRQRSRDDEGLIPVVCFRKPKTGSSVDKSLYSEISPPQGWKDSLSVLSLLFSLDFVISHPHQRLVSRWGGQMARSVCVRRGVLFVSSSTRRFTAK